MKPAATLFISILFLAAMPWTGTAQHLREHASFQWNNLPLRISIDSLMRWYSESIVFLDADVEGKFVTASCSNCNFDESLRAVLNGASLIWIRRGNQIILKRSEFSRDQNLFSISGIITDSLTGERIAGASVILQDDNFQVLKTKKRWCSSNAFGFFSLPDVQFGNYTMTVRAIGYETATRIVDNSTEKSVQYSTCLMPKEIVMNVVTIEGHRTALASVEKFSRGAYRRSVPADQNQYMLDGGRIYNPAHFGGVLNTFCSEALTDVDILIGGLPPSYGGRIGGIVDLSMRNGSRRRFTGSAGLGTLGAQLSLEGPIAERTTFLISGRRGYPDATQKFIPREGIKPSETIFDEITAKFTQGLSGSDQISLSGYFGKDKYRNNAEGVGEYLSNNFSWSNSMVVFRWSGIASATLFLHTSAAFSKYNFDLQHRLNKNSSTAENKLLSSNYSIQDWNINAHAESYYTEDHTLKAGIELIHHGIAANISEFSNLIVPFVLQNYSAWEAAVYMQDQWKILPRVTAELGGRATSFTSKNGSFSAIDPRFSLMVSLDEQTRLYGSFSAINQFLHPYRSSGVFLLYPAIFWYPSTEKIQPSTSLHVKLGAEHSFIDDTYLLSAEVYYRITNNLHEFRNDTSEFQIKDLEQLSLSGTGKTYGLQCGLKKRLGVFTGAINYTLSWAYKSFSEINDGQDFIPPFDRRHELQITSSFAIGENWTFSALCVAASGQTFPAEPISVPINVAITRGTFVEQSNFSGFIDVNGSRLPGFQRLELNLTHQFAFRDYPCQVSLRLLNSYGLVDPFKWKLHRINRSLRWNAIMQDVALFPLYPAIEMLVRF